jgi:ribose transport system substrate-binding protein
MVAGPKRASIRSSSLVKIVLAVAAMAPLVLAGCSSPSSSGATGGSAAATGGSAANSSSCASSSLQAEVAKYEQPPTNAYANLPPLKSKPPTGKTAVFLTTSQPQGEQNAAGFAAAAKAVGWTYKGILVNLADPSSVVSALNEAVNTYHATVVGMIGVNKSEIQSTFANAEKAGTIYVPGSYMDAPSGPVPVAVATSAYYAMQGQMTADWVAVQSKCTAHVLYNAVDSYPALGAVHQGFTSELKRVCPNCTVSVAQLTVDQANNQQGVPVVTAALQRDHSINYVISSNGAFTQGLTAALTSVGLAKNITIASTFGDVLNQSAILQGKEGMTTGTANNISGWLAIDAALRHVEGMPYQSNLYAFTPTQVMTKSNSSTWTVSSDFQVPTNYASLFEGAWQVDR